MEELRVIETTEGRQFKPWASREDVQAIKQETVQAVGQAVQDPASITAITSEIASGKQVIAQAINAKGGSASATESLTELAQAVEDIPNFDDMVKLAGIIAGGNYNKNALQGHNENVKYGKTEIIDNVGAFETINVSWCFQYWDLITKLEFPYLTTFTSNVFNNMSSLRIFKAISYTGVTGHDSYVLRYCTNVEELITPAVTKLYNHFYGDIGSNLKKLVLGTVTLWSHLNFKPAPNLSNVILGANTDVSVIYLNWWTATNVIAESAAAITELNDNLYNNLLTKLYDHSQDGETRTMRIGWLSRVTADNIAYANAKGWTLTT